jgi:hypothetical protein
MTNVATLSVDIIAHDKVSAVLTKLDGQLARTNQSATRTGAAIGTGIGGGTQKAASGALALQQAQARLETQQGNLAAAAQRLQHALAQVGTTSVQTINAQRQLLAVQTQMATGTSALGGHFKSLEGSIGAVGGAIGGLPGQLLSVSSGIGALTAAVGVGVSVFNSFADAFKFKAELDATTASITAQLKGVRDSGQTFADAASFANKYKLTQQETTEAIAASIGVMRASKAPIEDILGVLARMQVLSPEQSLQEAAIALKALASGDTTSLVTRFEVGRDVANQMKAEIQGGADAVAVMSKFLGDTGIGMDTLAAKTTGAMGAMKELSQAQEQLQLAQAAFAQGPGLQILQAQIALTRNATNLLSGDFKTLANDLGVLAVATNPLVSALTAVGVADDFLIGKINELAGTSIPSLFAPMEMMIDEWARFLGIATPVAPVIDQTSTAFDSYRAAATASAMASAAAAAEVAAMTGEINTNAQAAVLAAGQQQAQTIATQALTQETNAAVNAFLALNPNLDAAGIASAIAAGKVPPLIGQLAALRLAADATAAALGRLAAQQAGVAGVSKLFAAGVTGQTGSAGGIAGRLGGGGGSISREQDALRQSERDLALARAGSAEEQIALLQAQADKTVNLIEKNKLLIRIEGLKNKGAKGAKGAGGGGAAGAKLTDAQKLNNQLLTSQEQYAQKSEDAEQSHLDRLLAINEDFQEKMKDAQENFAQSRLDGDASFYSALGDVTDHGLQQAMSAQYEAAFLEAEQIAKTKGADVADAFLKAKEAQILAQGKRTAEIAKAEEEGDAGKAEYLRGVDAKYKAAEERRLAAIAAGDDSVAAQRDKALAEEGDKYAAAQDKLAESSERSEARAITAAQNRGAAIDAEKLKVDGVADSYARIGANAARAGVTPTGTLPGASTAATTSPAGTTAAEAGNPVLAALEALRAAVDNVGAAMVAAERDTTAAVRRISASGGIAG